MTGKRVLVAGASGLVGSAAVRRFVALGWTVTGVSRRAPADPVPGVDYLPLDLRDAESCATVVAAIRSVSHLVYAAINETPGDLVASWSDPGHAGRNALMFGNLVDALLDRGGLDHIGLVHGGKAYTPGRPTELPIPLRETLPRYGNEDFYFRQEDLLWDRAAGGAFTWTIYRPMIVVGGARESNLNGLLAICMLAVLRRAAGRPFSPPASIANAAVLEMTDVDLLVDGIAWGATAPGAANRTFNITNGDVFTWRDLWPVIAEEIGVAVGAPEASSIRTEIARAAGDWAALVRTHRLAVPEDASVYLGESAALADYALAADRSVVTSTIRIRQAGFHRFVDTADSVVGWIRRWREMGMLPPR